MSFRRAIMINFVSSSGATIVHFFVTLLLARLLTPSDIGIYSITVVFVNIANIFRDFGVGSYIQSEKNLTNDKIRSAMGIMFSSTWAIALLLYGSAQVISNFFGYPAMVPVVHVLASGFLFIPFGSLVMSLMHRGFQADKLAWVTVASTTAYATTCLFLAYIGFGAMSMAWANLASIVASACVCAFMRPVGLPWLPSFKGWGRIVKFSTGTLLTNSINALNNALPDMLLGKLGTSHQVGLLSRANSTVNIFTQMAGSAVNFGSLSYISQAFYRNESLSPILNRSVGLLTGFGWPALALTAFLSNEIILTLYGSTWVSCTSAIPALAISAGIAMMFNYTGTALIATGKPYLASIPIILTVISRITMATVFFANDIEKFSRVILGATVLTSIPYFYLQSTILKYKITEMIKVLSKSMFVTLCCLLTCSIIIYILPSSTRPWQTLSIIAAPTVAAWYFSIRLCSHVALDEINNIFIKIYEKIPFKN